MKIRSLLLGTALALSCAAASAQALSDGPCHAKQEDIGRSIEAAKANGQTHRVRGLQKALAEVQSNCSDGRLQADHQKRIARQEATVAERESDLQKAQSDGDAKKVVRRHNKLLEEQAKLQQLKDAKY